MFVVDYSASTKTCGIIIHKDFFILKQQRENNINGPMSPDSWNSSFPSGQCNHLLKPQSQTTTTSHYRGPMWAGCRGQITGGTVRSVWQSRQITSCSQSGNTCDRRTCFTALERILEFLLINPKSELWPFNCATASSDLLLQCSRYFATVCIAEKLDHVLNSALLIDIFHSIFSQCALW